MFVFLFHSSEKKKIVFLCMCQKQHHWFRRFIQMQWYKVEKTAEKISLRNLVLLFYFEKAGTFFFFYFQCNMQFSWIGIFLWRVQRMFYFWQLFSEKLLQKSHEIYANFFFMGYNRRLNCVALFFSSYSFLLFWK